MKRFHVHVSVDDLEAGVAFYSKLFGVAATVRQPDYAKWMLDDPRVNFAISARGGKAGVNHLGIQVDSDDELQSMHAQLAAADAGLVEETGANCCYARSDKYWVTDPAGVAWETYHTLGSIPTFGGRASIDDGGREANRSAENACCGPASASVSAAIPSKTKPGCCG